MWSEEKLQVTLYDVYNSSQVRDSQYKVQTCQGEDKPQSQKGGYRIEFNFDTPIQRSQFRAYIPQFIFDSL